MPPPVTRIPPRPGPIQGATVQASNPPILIPPIQAWRWTAVAQIPQTRRPNFVPDPRSANVGAQPRFPLPPPEPWRWSVNAWAQYPRTFQPDPRTADRTQPRFPLPPPEPWRWFTTPRAVPFPFPFPSAAVVTPVAFEPGIRSPEPWRWRTTPQAMAFPFPALGTTDTMTGAFSAIPLIYEQRWPMLRPFGLQVFDNPAAVVQPTVSGIAPPEPWRWQTARPTPALSLPWGQPDLDVLRQVALDTWRWVTTRPPGTFAVDPRSADVGAQPRVSLPPPEYWRYLTTPLTGAFPFPQPSAVAAPVPLTLGFLPPEPWRWQTLTRAPWASLLFDNPVPAVQTDTPGIRAPEPWRWAVQYPTRGIPTQFDTPVVDVMTGAFSAVPLIYEMRWPMQRPFGLGLFDNPAVAADTNAVFRLWPVDPRFWVPHLPPPPTPDSQYIPQLVLVVDTDVPGIGPPEPWRWIIALRQPGMRVVFYVPDNASQPIVDVFMIMGMM